MLLQVLQVRFNGSFSNSWLVKALNKLARQLKSQPVKLQYWPLTGPLRILDFLMPLTETTTMALHGEA